MVKGHFLNDLYYSFYKTFSTSEKVTQVDKCTGLGSMTEDY